MKDYMFLFRGGYDAIKRSPEEMQQHMGKWFSWVDKLKAEGRYVMGHPLTPDGKTVKGKKMLFTDGAFAEGKELVGGYFIVKADSFEQAADLAKDYPDYEFDGSVEIREVMAM